MNLFLLETTRVNLQAEKPEQVLGSVSLICLIRVDCKCAAVCEETHPQCKQTGHT